MIIEEKAHGPTEAGEAKVTSCFRLPTVSKKRSPGTTLAALRSRGIGQAQAPGELSQVSSEVGGGLLAIAPATGLDCVVCGGGRRDCGTGGCRLAAVSRLRRNLHRSNHHRQPGPQPYLIQKDQILFLRIRIERLRIRQRRATPSSRSGPQYSQNCGNPQLGTAGQNRITERGPNATGCTFGKTTANEYPP